MISELRLLFFASAIYFLVNHFGMFKQIDEVMKGQDEIMILSVKVGSTILILYLLINFSKTKGVVEGVANENTNHGIREFYEKIQQAVDEKDIVGISEYVSEAETSGRISDWMVYDLVPECSEIIKKYPGNGDDMGAIRCMKLRLTDNAECKIVSLSHTNECMVENIMNSMGSAVKSEKERENYFSIISEEMMNDENMVKKMELSNKYDKVILSMHTKGEDRDVRIQEILYSHSDILREDEKKVLKAILQEDKKSS